MGTINYSLGKIKESTDYLKQAIEYLNRRDRANTYFNLAAIILEEGDFSEASKYIELTFNTAKQTNQHDLEILMNNSIASYWLNNNILDSAELYINKLTINHSNMNSLRSLLFLFTQISVR